MVPGDTGLLWFCTSEGLARFDGFQFRVFRAADGLPSREPANLFASGLAVPSGLAFDTAGNLYEGDVGSPTLAKQKAKIRAHGLLLQFRTALTFLAATEELMMPPVEAACKPGPDRMTGTRAMQATDFRSAKRKLSVVTCYDYSFARLLNTTSIDALLVGDSAAMVMHGYASTVFADLPMMSAHTAAVARGAPDKFIIADMPFLSFRHGISTALDAARTLLVAGANAVKLEGVDGHADVIAHLVQSGIPVMGHVGLQPQSINTYGGYRVQGRTEEAGRAILRQARDLEALGAFSVVLECVPGLLAAEITAALDIPTIGIGAGAECDGQVLVLQDLLGMNMDFRPRFVRPFIEGVNCITDAISRFDAAVKEGSFPAVEESYR